MSVQFPAFDAEDKPILVVDRKKASRDICKRLTYVNKLFPKNFDESYSTLQEAISEACIWDDYNVDLLRKLFSTNAIADEYKRKGGESVREHRSHDQQLDAFTRWVGDKVDALRSIEYRLEFYDPTRNASQTSKVPKVRWSGRVFIIHGHDELLKQTTARLVSEIGLEPIILHEKPNGGRTIIEKFEQHADVGFAIALFTPDDYGGPVGNLAASKPHEHRARQNVVFETGFFYGKLGRGRVAVLHQDSTAVLTDLSGIVYIHLDAVGKWKHDLAKELEHAGYKVNHSKVV
ncbi:MAG TPA: nucleotide-binding protein [Phycisphaerales bacterium]|nr:nucleotide-binding protein [Phycisphaerales bacterium]